MNEYFCDSHWAYHWRIIYLIQIYLKDYVKNYYTQQTNYYINKGGKDDTYAYCK